MQPIPNKAGTSSNIEPSWEDGGFGGNSSASQNLNDLFERANSVSILDIFKYYGKKCNNNKMICPFLHHKGGKEGTPSFNVFPETNSFFCFGCQTGGRPSDFVHYMDSINKVEAANKIIKHFNFSNSLCFDITEYHHAESFEEMISFSNFIRDCHQKYPENYSFFEEALSTFDNLYEKYSLDCELESLKQLINKLKYKINLKIGNIHE